MTNAEQHRIHAEAWERLVKKLRELDRDQSVYITMDHARCLVGAIEREARGVGAAVKAEREYYVPVVHHMTLMLEEYGRHSQGCHCTFDQVIHAADCADCDCGLADALKFGVEIGGPTEPPPMTPEEEQRFHEAGKRIVDKLLAETFARAKAEP